MKHSHLTFFQNSSNPDISSDAGTNSDQSLFGGVDLMNLNIVGLSSPTGMATTTSIVEKSATEKQMEIIEYLRKFSQEKKATFDDFERDLGINLHQDRRVLNMLLNNPKIIYSIDGDKNYYFQFRSKFDIKNKMELLHMIERVGNGISLNDIKHCYPDIANDCNSMIMSGQIIALKNRDLKTLILYPRGDPFYSRLSGTITAKPREAIVETSTDLQSEIYRGEAIKVGDYWYRISSSIGSGAANEQNLRSLAPTSVTIDKPPSLGRSNRPGDPMTSKTRHEYHLPFTSTSLPLDGEYDGEEVYTGVALKYGCTSDVKDVWNKSMESLRDLIQNNNHTLVVEDKNKQVQQQQQMIFAAKNVDDIVKKELVKLNLISPSALSFDSSTNKAQANKKRKAIRKPRESKNQTLGFNGVNAHLRGTEIEKILNETRSKLNNMGR